MPADATYELPIFSVYPELMKVRPVLKYFDGKWVIEWHAITDDREVTLVLHAFLPERPLWSYAIYDKGTNTITHHVGQQADPDKDPVLRIEQGKQPT